MRLEEGLQPQGNRSRRGSAHATASSGSLVTALSRWTRERRAPIGRQRRQDEFDERIALGTGHGRLKFVDLFSGLGGFHAALSRLGHDCVLASEIDAKLQDLYHANFGIRPLADIRDCWEHVPSHDILCAGFPCQPFSKAGNQLGFECPRSGDLFEYILRIIDRHTPRFLIFENVPNILRHADGETWARIRDSLIERDYSVDFIELSPHLIGVPQIRYRAFIVASLGSLKDFHWPESPPTGEDLHLSTVLDTRPEDADTLSDRYIRYLEVWEEFLGLVDDDAKMPSFPIWAMEFGATYPYRKRNPSAYSQRYLARFNGGFGQTVIRQDETAADGRTATLRPGRHAVPPLEDELHSTESGLLCDSRGPSPGLAPQGQRVSAELPETSSGIGRPGPGAFGTSLSNSGRRA